VRASAGTPLENLSIGTLAAASRTCYTLKKVHFQRVVVRSRWSEDAQGLGQIVHGHRVEQLNQRLRLVPIYTHRSNTSG
jgi:hypothetical protein